MLEKVGANVLGVVLNKFTPSGRSGYYNHNYGYYTSETTNTSKKKK